jgi:hypothetical protein
MPPPPQCGVPRARGPHAAPREVGSGMNGGVPVSHRTAQAPQGIHNLGKALITICTLTSFPPTQGTPAYEAWEVRIKELTAYMHRRNDTAHSHSRSVAQGTGATSMHLGGAAGDAVHPGAGEPAVAAKHTWPRLRCPSQKPPPKWRQMESVPSLSQLDHRLLNAIVRSTAGPRSSAKRSLR